jgi:hypothetical protein
MTEGQAIHHTELENILAFKGTLAYTHHEQTSNTLRPSPCPSRPTSPKPSWTRSSGALPVFFAATTDDPAAAHDAASHMLAAYNVETEEELSLAAEIVSFGLHTLKALSDGADPDLSLNKVLRLRGNAVSLSRQQHKAQHKLDQLQRARRNGSHQQPAESLPATPALPKIDRPEPAPAQAPMRKSGQTWTQMFQKRQTAARIADTLKKNQVRHTDLAVDLTVEENRRSTA